MEPTEPVDDFVPLTKEQKKNSKNLKQRLTFARKKVHNHNSRRSRKKITEENAAEERDKLLKIQALENNTIAIITPEIKQEIEDFYPTVIENKKVGWEPFVGPQTHFLEADEFEVLFSGGRAPGKSDALLIDPLRFCHLSYFRGLLIRKAMQDLRDLIRRAKELFPLAFPGTRWKEQEKLFVFPSGATIECGYCDHEDDVGRYLGQEYSWLGIDELTQLEKEETYEKLVACIRKGGEGIKNYVRATTNPSGVGKAWVKRRWVDKGPMGKSIIIPTFIPQLNRTVVRTRKWIHGTVFDNPKVVAENPEYIAMLQSIDNEVLRAQWLEGDWDTAEGLAFDEFDRKVHVIKPFTIPVNWHKFRACDWGFKTKAVCLWMAVDYDGTVYVYRELVTGGGKVIAPRFGEMVLEIEREAKETVRYGVLDASAWSQRGENAPAPAEDMAGLSWRPSDRTKHSRLTGKLQVHNYLQKDPISGKPKVFIFDNCLDLISCLTSLPINKNDPEDVKDDGDDHAYDALRYGLMTRPRLNNNYNFGITQAEPQPILDKVFGY